MIINGAPETLFKIVHLISSIYFMHYLQVRLSMAIESEEN